MDTKTLSGCGTALVTPYADGKVDYAAYEMLIDAQVAAGIDFLLALGTTAETPCLTDDEKVNLLRITRERAPHLPIIAGVGTNSLMHTIDNMRLLRDADMYLVVVPYYNKPTAKGQYEYFKAVATATDKPIMLYNVPSRTGANMTAHTTLQLAQIHNIVSIKEASGNLKQIREIIAGAPEGFTVFSGNDDQTLDIITEGGAGVVSVASNIVPELMVEMVTTARNGKLNEAFMLFRKLIPLFDACFVESNPIPAKAAMHYLGMMRNEFRLPLAPCEQSTYDLMVNVLNKLGITR